MFLTKAGTQFAEIKIIAERKAGELLAEMAANGDRRGQGEKAETLHAATLSELGVSRLESHRFQQAAAAPAAAVQEAFREAEMHASRIRVRAERKLGEILKRMAQNGERTAKANGRPPEVSRDATHTLNDLGIPRDRASRAMQLAEVPQDQFDAALAQPASANLAALSLWRTEQRVRERLQLFEYPHHTAVPAV